MSVRLLVGRELPRWRAPTERIIVLSAALLAR
jgi:hypothetical protein